jgi:palmitoyltransferase
VSAADLEEVTALYLAARDGSKEFISLLIDNGAETAAKDNLGRTLLHCCVGLNYCAATKLLVDRGSSLSAMDNAGRTARELAQDAGNDRSVRALDGEPLSMSIIQGRVVFL